jgi:ABC-2 type transport system ATP-binding protein
LDSDRPLLEVRNLRRVFGKHVAVDDLSFEVGRGLIYGFIGPNGAGKTTTMRIVATLDLPDRGDAFVAGISVLADPRAVRRKIGFMSDQFVPYSNLDVGQFLDFFARAYGLRGEERRERVEGLATFCGLDDFITRPATGLSKGMGQRLHLAKTLLHDPELLILDEPTAGLDPHARIEFRELVKQLAARGKSVLVSSHILSELGEICDGVIIIEQGKRVAAGRIEDIAKSVRTHVRTLELKALGPIDVLEKFLMTEPDVKEVRAANGVVLCEYGGDDEALSAVMERAMARGLKIVGCRLLEADLEEIFLKTTRGKLQ